MTKPTQDSSNKLAVPTGEWLEKWITRCRAFVLLEINDANQAFADIELVEARAILTAIYSEVHAKARRETLKEVLDRFNRAIALGPWIAEQLAEKEAQR